MNLRNFTGIFTRKRAAKGALFGLVALTPSPAGAQTIYQCTPCRFGEWSSAGGTCHDIALETGNCGYGASGTLVPGWYRFSARSSAGSTSSAGSAGNAASINCTGYTCSASGGSGGSGASGGAAATISKVFVVDRQRSYSVSTSGGVSLSIDNVRQMYVTNGTNASRGGNGGDASASCAGKTDYYGFYASNSPTCSNGGNGGPGTAGSPGTAGVDGSYVLTKNSSVSAPSNGGSWQLCQIQQF